jgi:hypothetical protein
MPSLRSFELNRTACVALLSSLPMLLTSEPMFFTEVANSAGIAHTFQKAQLTGPNGEEYRFMLGGAVAEDFNADGWLDLFVVQSDNQTPCLLYINQQNGTFQDRAADFGLAITGIFTGTAAADYDADGDVDLFLARYQAPHILFRNQGNGTFQQVLVFSSLNPGFNFSSPSFGDVDNDGDLDLALGQWASYDSGNFELYINSNGNLNPQRLGNGTITQRYVYTPRFADVNGDRYQDLLLASDFTSSQLWINNQDGTFRNSTQASSVGIDQNGMGATVADYDNDGDLDWFVSSIFNLPSDGRFGNRLYRNKGDGTFEDVSDFSRTSNGQWGWGATFGDFDLDGDPDLFLTNGFDDNATPVFCADNARLYENLGNGRFTNVASQSGLADNRQGRGVISFDYDRDGDLDLFVTNNADFANGTPGCSFTEGGTPLLYRNDTPTTNKWIQVQLLGLQKPHHSQGIGSRIHVVTNGNTQMAELHASSNYMAQNPGRIAHFGLGQSSLVDSLKVVWTNADETILAPVSVNQEILITSAPEIPATRRLRVGEKLTNVTVQSVPEGVSLSWLVDDEELPHPLNLVALAPGKLIIEALQRDSITQTIIRRDRFEVEVLPGEATRWVVN